MGARRCEGRYSEGETSGPFGFLNHTQRRYKPLLHKLEREISREDLRKKESNGEADSGQTSTPRRGEIQTGDVERLFRTRDDRKGRHAIIVTPSLDRNVPYLTPPSTFTLRATLHNILRMFTIYPYWDISYFVAIVFTLGSVIWVFNAFFVWLPLQNPPGFKGEIANAGGITAFIGATVFDIGSVFLMLEAVNERSECFGWAIEDILGEAGVRRLRPGECVHHHGNKKNFIGKGKAGDEPMNTEIGPRSQHTSASVRTWTWWPTWKELRTHYFKEVGFLACLSQMIGATVFWISGFTALPPIYDRLTSTAAQNGAYWLPQVLGGTGFIISGTLFMLETQKKWYLPAFKVLGWHIGAWNLLGGIGFTLCGVLGFAAKNSGCVYQGSLATFWGSWCFLIGSVIQWFESLNKSPVDVKEGKEKATKGEAVAEQ